MFQLERGSLFMSGRFLNTFSRALQKVGHMHNATFSSDFCISLVVSSERQLVPGPCSEFSNLIFFLGILFLNSVPCFHASFPDEIWNCCLSIENLHYAQNKSFRRWFLLPCALWHNVYTTYLRLRWKAFVVQPDDQFLFFHNSSLRIDPFPGLNWCFTETLSSHEYSQFILA